MESSNSGRGKFALGALFAAVAGFVAGILTAPKSGRETRQDIKDAATKTKSEAEKKLKALHSELSQLIDEGKAMAKNLKDTAQKDLVDALAAAHIAKEKTREILSAIHEGDARDDTKGNDLDDDLQSAVDEAKKAVEHLKKYVKKSDTKAA